MNEWIMGLWALGAAQLIGWGLLLVCISASRKARPAPAVLPLMAPAHAPYGLLETHQGSASALLCASFFRTHAHILTEGGMDSAVINGSRAVSYAFVHEPSGRHYVIAIAEHPESL